jgi:hypothetical protein
MFLLLFHIRIHRVILKGGNNYWSVCEFGVVHDVNLCVKFKIFLLFIKGIGYFGKIIINIVKICT